MRNVKSLLLMAGVVSTLYVFQACDGTGSSGAPSLSAHVPSNSTFVMSVNMGDLLTKMDYDAFKETTYFQDRMEELDSNDMLLSQFMEDPSSIGLDMDGEMVVSVVFTDDMDDPDAYIMAGISDIEKANNLVSKMTDMDGMEKVESDGITLYTNGEEKNVAHNDKMIVLCSSGDMETLKSIFNPTDGGVASNADFQKHYKQGKDFMAWINTTPGVEMFFDSDEGKMTKGSMQMAQFNPDWLLDNYMSFYYDFLNGEIDAGTSFDMNDDLREEFGDIFPNKLNLDFSSMMPSEEMLMSMTLGINTSPLLQALEERGFLMMLDPFVESETNFTISELNEMIGGEVGFAIYAEEGMIIPPVLAIMSINDKKSVEELVMQLASQGIQVNQDGDNWTINLGPQQILANLNNERLLITNSEDIFSDAMNGTSNDVVEDIQDGWMGFYLNYAELENAIESSPFLANQFDMDDLFGTSSINNMVESIMVRAKGGDIEGKTFFKDDSVNSLKKLVEYGEKLHVMNKELMEEFMKEFESEMDEYDALESEMDDLEINFET